MDAGAQKTTATCYDAQAVQVINPNTKVLVETIDIIPAGSKVEANLQSIHSPTCSADTVHVVSENIVAQQSNFSPEYFIDMMPIAEGAEVFVTDAFEEGLNTEVDVESDIGLHIEILSTIKGGEDITLTGQRPHDNEDLTELFFSHDVSVLERKRIEEANNEKVTAEFHSDLWNV